MAEPAVERNEAQEKLLAEIERTAVELARLAGAEIVNALGGLLSIKYKSDLAADLDAMTYRDPVSEVDHRCEVLLRARIAERFPDHDIIGEEINDRAPDTPYADYIWAVDPIDGTSNFINGFPMFAASIGVIHHGRPVVGALWCSTTHALRAGIYHGRAGGKLQFDEQPIDRKPNPAVQRRLAGDPTGGSGGGKDLGFMWETRKTGSAAVECAFVAAGLLRVARFETPNLWDVAGGVALVKAAGLTVHDFDDGSWQPLDRFEPVEGDIRRWRRPVLLGEPQAVAQLAKAFPNGR
jgi:myo-inositol-1(or 4)-monophosphatase